MENNKGKESSNLNAPLIMMRFVADFDRPVDPDKHYLSPGGYSVELKDGRTIEFDFTDSIGDKSGSNFVEFIVTGLDTYAFPESEELTLESMKNCNFDEFFIFTGEYDDPEIYVTNIHDIVFTYNGEEEIIDVPFQGEIRNLGQSREIPLESEPELN